MAFTSEQIARAQSAAAALQAAGMATAFVPFALYQIAHETAGFTSRVYRSNNNLSGIKYVGQPGATKGSISPEGNYYASFESEKAWAKDYMRILGMGSRPPIKADSLTDFADRLKNNGYYTDTVANYTAGLQSWERQLSPLMPQLVSEKKNC